jgi:nucleoid-associated protein YgaU
VPHDDPPESEETVAGDESMTAMDADPESGTVAPPTIPAHQVIVTAGDNLWSLATEALEHHGVADPTSTTVATYWRLVVGGNRVRSGNANLIVPGEIIEMPRYDLAA